MQEVNKSAQQPATSDELPHPRNGARWRWSPGRRAAVGGGILAVALGLGGAAAGASTPTASPSAHPSMAPSDLKPPTAGGKVTSVGVGTITITTRQATSQVITYSSGTTFRSPSGTTTSSALAVGDFVGVIGTKNADGSVSATSIMVATKPPGQTGGPRGAGTSGTTPPGTGAPSTAS